MAVLVVTVVIVPPLGGASRFQSAASYNRSITPAIAWPKPMHIVAIP